MLPISNRAELSGSSSSSVGAPSAVRPVSAASASITRSVTKSCVSQRRNCLPSLVPARGSAAAGIASRSVASRASTSLTGTSTTGDGCGDMRVTHRTVTFTAGE